MRLILRSPQGFRRASRLVGALILLAAGAYTAAQAPAADDTNEAPPQAIAPVNFQNAITPDQLTFLNDYAGKPAKNVQKDNRFHALMKLVILHTTYHYGRDMWLSATIETMLDGKSTPTEIREGRYAMVSSASGNILNGKGFVWFDMREGIALGGVYFHPTNGEPAPTLAIFSRQLKDTSLSMNQLPEEFQKDLAKWILTARLRFVSPRYFIPENGKKYVLVHDEDYCSYAEGTAPPPRDKCEQLNAEAADADVNAAYFMAETHNAANATAWMLGSDQAAWVGLRDRSCGVVLACRIRFTRQRVRVLIRGR